MPEKSRVPSIPLIGKSGLLAILGCIVGAFVHAYLGRTLATQAWAKTKIVGGFLAVDALCVVIPLFLMVVIRRFRAFFIGWLVGVLSVEFYYWFAGGGGWPEGGIISGGAVTP